MSWPALGWASKQKPGRVADKMVLIALADRHSEETGIAYPSIAWLAEFACLDRKTVVASLARLEAAGLIADSGQRMGKTKQIKAYTLSLKDTEKGDPKTVPLEAKSTVFSGKEYRKRDTEPSKEPCSSEATLLQNRKRRLSVAERDWLENWPKPEWADPAVWADLAKNRKGKNAPNTVTAYRQFVEKVEGMADVHWPPGKLLVAIVGKGWAGAYDPRENRTGNGNGRQENRGLHPNRDNRDGVAKALDRRLGLDGSAGETGRGNAGGGEVHRQLPAPAASAVR